MSPWGRARWWSCGLRFRVDKTFASCLGLLLAGLLTPWAQAQEFQALPETSAPDAKQAALGRILFFDGRLSGDGSTSCATCHVPEKAFIDGAPLAAGYPGALYFRNTPTVINAHLGKYLYWDGRMTVADLPTLVRDHIAEAHFMQTDGRLLIERMRQVPEYEQGFKDAFGGEPSYGRILNAVAAYLGTLTSSNAPLDRYLAGEKKALGKKAKKGMALFKGKAGCVQCHHGPMLSDGQFHALGVPENPNIFAEPKRHITFRRFFRTLGIPQFESLREDIGRYAITKQDEDWKAFRTPTLREVARTAPYMHNGVFATLPEVVDFYDDLRSLGLNAGEKEALVEFLNALSGDPIAEETPTLPEYKLRTLGEN